VTEYLSKQDAAIVRERKQVVIDRELDRLYEEHGNITTDLVLRTARDPKHPLHQYFEWDDEAAAEKYRQHQALQMIMASKMVVVLEKAANGGPPRVVASERPEVRRLVAGFRGEGFKMRKEALSNDEERAVMVERAMSRLRGWCDSTVDIPELSRLRAVVLREIEREATVERKAS
jgi:hypothetical protein